MSYLLYHGICDHHFVHKLTQLAPDSLSIFQFDVH